MRCRTSSRALGLLAWLAVTALAACSGVAKGEFETVRKTPRADPGKFRTAGVSTVFEKRCGSLDCHASLARNMRIYSSRGLRLPNDAGLVPGGGDTTLDESTANYQSILALEPEATQKVLDGSA